ncbi:MAG: DUF4270 family protein [Sphingobacteriales bacterium]|nr:MAG: DUF4270 family protein [Sphingobacteriales bacterium]
MSKKDPLKQKSSCFLPALFAAGFLLFGLNSCKEDTILNADIIPAGDTVSLSTTDSITILTKTVFDDSFITSQSVTGIPLYHPIGTVATDPYFGKSHAASYFQVIPPTLGFTFPKTPDSAFIILPYSGFTWGDTTDPNATQTFTVYEVTDSLSRDSVYYNFTNKAVDRSAAGVIGSVTVSLKAVKDSMERNGKLRPPHLRIPVSAAFITKMKTESDKSESALDTYPAFFRFLKGLYVEPDTNNGRYMSYFRLDGNDEYSRANILFYYTEDSVKTQSFYYTSTYNAHYTRFRRNFSGTPTGALIASTIVSDSVIIIQNEPGAVGDLKFPFIKNLPKQPINKAELIITEYSFAGDNKDKFTSPARIFPIGIDAEGKSYTILDRFPLSSASPLVFMDGTRRTMQLGPITVNQYILNIPREVQRAIVEQRDTLHLRISGASTYPGAYRLIGAGGKSFSNPSMRVKLNIVYSKI